MTTSNLQIAWVLHRRPYKDTGLIVELLTSQNGRVGVVARGGRKNHLLQPFQPLLVQLRGAGDLRTLHSVEPAQAAINLTGEYLYCGIYLNELLVRLLERHYPQTELITFYADALEELANGALPKDVILRQFELALLAQLGYAIDFTHDAAGNELASEQRYGWVAEQGWLAHSTGFLGAHLLAIGQQQWHAEVRKTAKNAMRIILAPHLGHQPLRSRQLFSTQAFTNDRNGT